MIQYNTPIFKKKVIPQKIRYPLDDIDFVIEYYDSTRGYSEDFVRGCQFSKKILLIIEAVKERFPLSLMAECYGKGLITINVIDKYCPLDHELVDGLRDKLTYEELLSTSLTVMNLHRYDQPYSEYLCDIRNGRRVNNNIIAKLEDLLWGFDRLNVVAFYNSSRTRLASCNRPLVICINEDEDSLGESVTYVKLGMLEDFIDEEIDNILGYTSWIMKPLIIPE